MEQKYGTEFWRPDLFAMLTAVQQGRVNAVMVQSLDRLSHDIATLYRILRFLQNYGAVLITTETNLQYELYLTGLESQILARTAQMCIRDRVEAVLVRDLEQISRNSYILVGVIEILRQNDVYLITTECDLNAELINCGLERFVGDRFTRASFGKPRFDVRLPLMDQF